MTSTLTASLSPPSAGAAPQMAPHPRPGPGRGQMGAGGAGALPGGAAAVSAGRARRDLGAAARPDLRHGRLGAGLGGLKALRDRTLDVDLLMVVAAIGAAAIGQLLDGALLIVIFATSGALEAVATARTADSVRGLLDLAPATATRLLPGAARRRWPPRRWPSATPCWSAPASGSGRTAGCWTG
ncbi:hypothetical protein NKH77_07860 [Streptomyces sp. M19]